MKSRKNPSLHHFQEGDGRHGLVGVGLDERDDDDGRDVEGELDDGGQDLSRQGENVSALPRVEGVLGDDGLLEHLVVVPLDEAEDEDVHRERGHLAPDAGKERQLDVPVGALRIKVALVGHQNFLKGAGWLRHIFIFLKLRCLSNCSLDILPILWRSRVRLKPSK